MGDSMEQSDEDLGRGKRPAADPRPPHGEAAEPPKKKKVRGPGKKKGVVASTLMAAAAVCGLGSGADLLLPRGPEPPSSAGASIGAQPSIIPSSAPRGCDAATVVADSVKKAMEYEKKEEKQAPVHWKHSRTWKLFFNIVNRIKPIGKASWIHVAQLFRAAVAAFNDQQGAEKEMITCGALTVCGKQLSDRWGYLNRDDKPTGVNEKDEQKRIAQDIEARIVESVNTGECGTEYNKGVPKELLRQFDEADDSDSGGVVGEGGAAGGGSAATGQGGASDGQGGSAATGQGVASAGQGGSAATGQGVASAGQGGAATGSSSGAGLTHVEQQVLNPQPQTYIPKPPSPNPQPSTLIPQPSILIPCPKTRWRLASVARSPRLPRRR